jgi:3-dehydroquinate synthase
MRHVAQIHEAINKAGMCRHSYVVAIGGGAVIDAVGYAAATAHRGVRLVRVPTTVLAQCDAAIGVKNGINHFDKKNFLGTFTPPFAVINDTTFLTTLSARDWRAGVAEAVKVALIKDAAFFDFIEENAGRLLWRDMIVMQKLIHRCAQLHLDHIAHDGDPFEHGSSRPLDFGHWCAHKLEQLTDYQLRHGEAVAIGIAVDSTYSYVMGFLSETVWRRILRLLFTLGFALCVAELAEYLDRPGHKRCVLRGLVEFREHLGGRLTVTLLRDIGHGFEVNDMNVPMLIESIAILRRNDANRWKGGWQWMPKPVYVH